MASQPAIGITFVLPSSALEMIVRFWFRLLRWLFDLRLHWTNDYLQRDRIMALYAPIALISLLPIWLVPVTLGVACLYRPTAPPSHCLTVFPATSLPTAV